MQFIKAIRANAEIRDAIPITMILATAVVNALWNLHTGIVYRAPLALVFVMPTWPLLVAIFYTSVRPDRQISEAALYLSLILFYAAFGVQFSYLGQALDYPLRDADFARIDATLGFDARMWFSFSSAHPWFQYAQGLAYYAYYWLPLVSIPIFARYCPGRNREMLIGIIIASSAAIVIAAFIPAMGRPISPAPWVHIIEVLRFGTGEPLPYFGVIKFPSVHAAVAVLLITSHRGMKWTFLPVLLVDLLMLISLPVFGDHYLIDDLGGAATGLCSFFAAKWILRSADRFWTYEPSRPPLAART